MRILHVTREIGSDRRYGIGRSLAPVVQALQARGHEVRYLTQDDQSLRGRAWQQRWTERLGRWGERLAGAPGRVLAAVWIERLNMGRLAAKVARDMRADVVHLHDPWMAWGFRLARLVYRGPPLRWGVTEHGFGAYADAIGDDGVPYSPRLLRWHRGLERRILQVASWVCMPSHAACRQLARDLALPVPSAHWHVLPPPCPVPVSMDREQVRSALGWDDRRLHIMGVGRVQPVKRFDVLVRACLRLDRPVHLLILGGGEAHALKQVASEHPSALLELDVREVDDVTPYLVAADVYVSTSRSESYGLANLEALCAGVPAVCSAVGAVPEVMAGSASLVYGDDEGLTDRVAQSIADIAANLPRARAQAQRDAALTRNRPDAQAVAQLYESMYVRVA